MFPDQAVGLESFQLSRIHKLVLKVESGDLEAELRRCDGTGLINKPDKSGRTPLHWAVQKDDPELVQLLLTYGADPTVCHFDNACSLRIAKSVQVLRQCIQYCRPSHIQDCTCRGGNSLLVHCLFHSDFSQSDAIGVAKAILEVGEGFLDINSPDRQGHSPLTEAISSNKVEITKFLLEAGSDYNRVNKKGQTAAMVGLSKESHQALAVLFDEPREFDFTTKDQDGWNILHYLMQYSNTDILNLVSVIGITGVSINDENKNGQTARDILTNRMGTNKHRGGSFFYALGRTNLEEVFHSFLDRVEGASRVSQVEQSFDRDSEVNTESSSQSGDADCDDEFCDALESLVLSDL
ncbi:hypothetical protein TWF730_008899 [Orbilia blumenaviensis]|uniref:Uncharacterized protein n=1 Tax=Orbilia blumenaviensis TaxID=1796055 RepID=A0AAV9UZJ2_9PEZI